MKDERDSLESVERRLQDFFQKKTDDLKAPSDLWAKLEPRLDEPKGIVLPGHAVKRRSTWLAGRRLAGVAAALAMVLLLLVTGLVWWTGDHGKGTPSAHELAVSGTYDAAIGAQGSAGPAGEGNATGQLSLGIPMGTSTPVPAPTATPGQFWSGDTGLNKSDSGINFSSTATGGNLLDTAQRQVISTASISLEVQTVDTAISQIRGIAESLGGFLEQMSSSGSEDTEQATVTIRVPQQQFFTALDRLQALGKVQNQNVGSQDVTEQFIDLEARLKSAQQEEQSLLSLLDKTQTIADIINLDKELSQVRSNIETIQGQLNYLGRRVDLATIDVSLSTPAKEVGQPPSGSMTIEVHDVGASMASVKGLVSSVNGELGQVNISVNKGKETASLSLQLYRADFDRVVSLIERQGNTQQKYIQEGTTPKGAQAKPTDKPDAYMSLTLIEAETHGFWTSGNIKVVSITGGVVLAALLGFLYLAYRAGLLQKRAS